MKKKIDWRILGRIQQSISQIMLAPFCTQEGSNYGSDPRTSNEDAYDSIRAISVTGYGIALNHVEATNIVCNLPLSASASL